MATGFVEQPLASLGLLNTFSERSKGLFHFKRKTVGHLNTGVNMWHYFFNATIYHWLSYVRVGQYLQTYKWFVCT